MNVQCNVMHRIFFYDCGNFRKKSYKHIAAYLEVDFPMFHFLPAQQHIDLGTNFK